MKNAGLSTLRERYRILRETLEFRLPEIECWYLPGNSVLAPTARDVASWFDDFAEEVIEAAGVRHLSVARLSDGEYRLQFGPRVASSRAPLAARAKSVLGLVKYKLNPWARLVAGAAGQYESETYKRNELRQLRDAYAVSRGQIADQGYRALHLEHGRAPFAEQYFPPLARWLDANEIRLSSSTYVTFYFVFAMLAGSHRERLFRDRKVLVVTHVDAASRQRVERRLMKLGVSTVAWLEISQRRSGFDRLEVCCATTGSGHGTGRRRPRHTAACAST